MKNFKEGQSGTKAGENDPTGTATDTTTATDQSENNGFNFLIIHNLIYFIAIIRV